MIVCFVDIGGIVDDCLEAIVRFVDICGIVDDCLEVIVHFVDIGELLITTV